MLKNTNHSAVLMSMIVLAVSSCGIQTLQAGYIVGGNSYTYRQEITVDSSLTASNLTNYPLLVQITNSANPVFTNSLGGSDIVFTAADGSTVLSREIENFTTGGTPSLNAWVKTDISSSSDTKIYMYYNGTSVPNSTATWDSNFAMVQHLEENAGPITDSTSLANDGTNVGSASSAGKIGNAFYFDGTDVVNLSNNASLFPATLTLEAWVRPDVVGTHNGIFTNKSDANHGVNLQTGTTQDLSALVGDGTSWTYIGEAYTNDAVSDTWYHLTLVHENGNENLFYVDGVQSGAVQLRGLDYGGTLPVAQIGAFYAGGVLKFSGIIDELRLSNEARSADWIRANYLLGDNASAFLTFGLEEMLPAPEPSTFLLLTLGCVGVIRQARRRLLQA